MKIQLMNWKRIKTDESFPVVYPINKFSRSSNSSSSTTTITTTTITITTTATTTTTTTVGS